LFLQETIYERRLGCGYHNGNSNNVFTMTTAKQQDTHKQHKQPQFYLKGFASHSVNPYQKTSDIWVYKKGELFKKGQNPSLESTKDTAFSKDFYAFIEEDGSINYNKYENLLMKDFEQPTIPVLEKIRRSERLDDNEKRIFSRYITSMKIRGNFGKKLFFDTKVMRQIETRQISVRQGCGEEEIKNIVKELLASHDKERESERDKIRMIEIAKKFANVVYKLTWRFFIAPNGCNFMTSDNPVSWEEINTPRAWLLFPISSSICLFASFFPYPKHKNWMEEENGFWAIDDEAFEGICDKLASSAIFEVYFSKEAEWLIKFINNRI
jgi:Protein of unknown function (DUF4238)